MAEIKLRVNPMLKEQLKKIANDESRSLNKQIEVFLDFALSENGLIVCLVLPDAVGAVIILIL